MGNFLFKIPEEIHDRLRHLSIDSKKDMKSIILEYIIEGLKKEEKKP